MPAREAGRGSTRRPRQRWRVLWELRRRGHRLALEWPGQGVGWRSFAEEGSQRTLKDRMQPACAGAEGEARGGRQHTARSGGRSRPLASLSGPEEAREGAGRNEARMQEARPRAANRRAPRPPLPQGFRSLPNAGSGSRYRGSASAPRRTLPASTPNPREGSTGTRGHLQARRQATLPATVVLPIGMLVSKIKVHTQKAKGGIGSAP